MEINILTEKLRPILDLPRQPWGKVCGMTQEFIADVQDEKASIAILGEFSVGKSTFLNALLGLELLSSDALPTTSTLTRISYGTQLSAEIYYMDGKSQPLSIEELSLWTVEGKGKDHDHVSYIQVYCPSEILKNFHLFDFPGSNSLHQRHSTIITEKLSRCYYAFYLFSANYPGMQTEVDNLQKIKNKIPRVYAVLNQIDLLEEEEYEDTLHTFKEQARAESVFFVSGLEALDAKLNEDWELWEISQFHQIEQFLETHVKQNPWDNVWLDRRIMEIISSLKNTAKIETSNSYPSLHNDVKSSQFDEGIQTLIYDALNLQEYKRIYKKLLLPFLEQKVVGVTESTEFSKQMEDVYEQLKNWLTEGQLLHRIRANDPRIEIIKVWEEKVQKNLDQQKKVKEQMKSLEPFKKKKRKLIWNIFFEVKDFMRKIRMYRLNNDLKTNEKTLSIFLVELTTYFHNFYSEQMSEIQNEMDSKVEVFNRSISQQVTAIKPFFSTYKDFYKTMGEPVIMIHELYNDLIKTNPQFKQSKKELADFDKNETFHLAIYYHILTDAFTSMKKWKTPTYDSNSQPIYFYLKQRSENIPLPSFKRPAIAGGGTAAILLVLNLFFVDNQHARVFSQATLEYHPYMREFTKEDLEFRAYDQWLFVDEKIRKDFLFGLQKEDQYNEHAIYLQHKAFLDDINSLDESDVQMNTHHFDTGVRFNFEVESRTGNERITRKGYMTLEGPTQKIMDFDVKETSETIVIVIDSTRQSIKDTYQSYINAQFGTTVYQADFTNLTTPSFRKRVSYDDSLDSIIGTLLEANIDDIKASGEHYKVTTTEVISEEASYSYEVLQHTVQKEYLFTADFKIDHIKEISVQSEQIFNFSNQEISNFMETFRERYETALNNGAPDWVSYYFNSDKDIYDEYVNYIRNADELYLNFDFQTFEITSIRKVDQEYRVDTIETFRATQSQPERDMEYLREKTYHLSVIDGELYIDDIEINYTEQD